MKRALRVLLLALALVFIPILTSAQSTIETEISAPETGLFPQVSTYFAVRDGEGRFLTGLTAGDVSIQENGLDIGAYSLEELRPGVQLAIAMNPSPTFAVRDSKGLTRYDYVASALLAWAEGRIGTNIDDLTLLSNGGLSQVHFSSYSALQSSLQGAPSDHRSAVPSLQALAQAIDIAGDPTPTSGMGKAILFITPHIELDTVPAVENLAARARQAGVRVFTWLVTSEAYFETQGSLALRQMSQDTGGQFFAYSGIETIPDPETYFEPLRSVYLLTYNSRISAGGEQQLVVQIDTGDASPLTLAQAFEISVLPPNPILVTPPDQIFRSLVPDAEGNFSEARREPDQQAIEILVEFPDGYDRELQRTTLYVNGQIAAENSTPPFDIFEWDLRNIRESGRFSLQVEAVDKLGLSSVSLETPVDITVQRVPEGFVPTLAQNSSLLTTVMVFLAGALLIFVLLRVRQLRPQPQVGNGRRNGKRQDDPVYQPVAAEGKPSRRLTRWASRLHWPSRQTARSEPYAYLEPIYEPGSLEARSPSPQLAIHTPEVTLGTDPEQATIVLEDPSVAHLHARIRQAQDGRFMVNDYETIGGTWVNYLPINGGSNRIEHGDLLHFGRVGFRFKLANHFNGPIPKIEKENTQG
jgi:hypothetical protein